jgi:hypothetical protein
MGLDIKCNKVDTRCSYSYIHVFRKMLIQSTIQFLESISFSKHFEAPETWSKYYCTEAKLDDDYEEYEQDYENNKKKTIEYLGAICESPGLFSSLTYRLISDPQPYFRSYIQVEERFHRFGIFGLLTFVDHSDCEGYFSPGQSLDILNLFMRIEPFIKKDTDEYMMYEDFLEIFKTSVDTKSYVYFM